MSHYNAGALTQSLEVLVGQLFVVALEEGNPVDAVRSHREHHYGGVFLRRSHLQHPVQTRRLTSRFRRVGGEIPPGIVSVDEEGGLVTTTSHLTTPAPSAALLGHLDDEDVTRDIYLGIGEKLRALGFNTVFAPVLDVNTEAKNPVIGTRSFGSSPDLVGRHGLAAVVGIKASGIAACVKHFPGHGATTLDSHLTMPQVTSDRATLMDRDLKPFRKVLESDTPLDMVMTAHVNYPALERGGAPATLSEGIVTGLLRRELGFRGIIITDSMEMQGITERYGPEKAAVVALDAGVDLILFGLDTQMAAAAMKGVVQAVRSGKITEERLTHSIDRVFRLRQKFRNIRWTSDEESREILELAHEPVFFDAAMRGVVLEGNAGVLADISSARGPKVIILPRQLNEHRTLPLSVVREQLEPAGFQLLDVSGKPNDDDLGRAERRAAEASVIVVGTASRGPMAEENKRLLNAVTKRDVIKVGVALLDPQDAEAMMTTNCRIKTFGFAAPQLWAMCQKLLG
ncbi:MAG TPA: glycoside hydrolase family 3 N-terminal domain-containing protein [Candidatus Eisenbacteria bacterium]|nr:glycoside hydrolase family 3 N-terminal domain-containing protein [Candidatus Eisenbacteria bacterium]